MTRNSYNNRRIARNSMLLYCRSVVTLVISLYTSRIVLEALGFEDFGVYALVGSTVTMFSLFSTSFISSTQRFINIAMERNGIDELSRISPHQSSCTGCSQPASSSSLKHWDCGLSTPN